MKNRIVIFWFRRDLRLEDNVGLREALKSGLPVLPLFIFDTNILGKLESVVDRRVDYIHQAVSLLHRDLSKQGSGMHIRLGTPLEIFKQLSTEYDLEAVYCNRDYEPAAIRRDREVQDWLQTHRIQFRDFKDLVIFEKSEILKDDGNPYIVYTPYSKKWKSKLSEVDYQSEFSLDMSLFLPSPLSSVLSLESIGFEKTDLVLEVPVLDENIIKDYDKYRDYPGLDLTTHLGVALRFGTISIRRCVALGVALNQTWLSELIWREFFMQILYHFPRVESQCFRPEYESIEWRNNKHEFARWCAGSTGYPIVDAGMRQLNQTGFMHNRVRMIAASFLAKHLLVDWRWGEAYFAQKLIDYDLASNNGNWQWAAGCGCDAAPYFRIFNPSIQTQKFDKHLTYITTWCPNYQDHWFAPLVIHEQARERALATYGKALKQSGL